MFISRLMGDPIRRIYIYEFFKDFAFFSAVLVPFFTEWGHISQFYIQIIQSWFSFWVFILEIPTGAIADKIGRKHSLTIGSFIVGLAVILYGSIPQFTVFLLAEFLFAIGYTLTSGADQALLYDTLKELGREHESKKVIGRAEAIHMLGIAAAAPIGSLIASHYGINAPMLASSVPFFLAALIGWSLREPKQNTGESSSPKYLAIVKRGLKTIRHNAVVRTLAIDSLLVSAATYFLIWLNQPLQLTVGIPVRYLGFTFALMLCIETLAASNFTFLEKFFGTGKAYIKRTALLTSLGFFIVAAIPNIWTIFLFVLLVGGLGYTRGSYIVAIANKYIDSNERATVLSSISMFRRFAIIIINPIIGYIATKSLTSALFLVGLLPLFTLFMHEEID